MATANESVKWQDLLEKEFDKAFVDLELLLDKHLSSNKEARHQVRQHLNAICSTFSQLNQRALTIFYNNAKLEAQLVSMRVDLANAQSQATAVAVAVTEPSSNASCVRQLTVENADLRRYCLALQSELYAARLAARYLDKELVGRVQQLQLLSNGGAVVRQQQAGSMGPAERRRLWSQLEAEIRLHRCKTVLRACRGRTVARLLPGAAASGLQQQPSVAASPRHVTLRKSAGEGLGMAIAGGREHGVPILVTELHPGQPAARCGQLRIGDAILSVDGASLRDARHADAARLLGNLAGCEVALVVAFVAPPVEVDGGGGCGGGEVSDDDGPDDEFVDVSTGYRFNMYDEEMITKSQQLRLKSGSRTTRESGGGPTPQRAAAGDKHKRSGLSRMQQSEAGASGAREQQSLDTPSLGPAPDISVTVSCSPQAAAAASSDDRYFSVPEDLDVAGAPDLPDG